MRTEISKFSFAYLHKIIQKNKEKTELFWKCATLLFSVHLPTLCQHHERFQSKETYGGDNRNQMTIGLILIELKVPLWVFLNIYWRNLESLQIIMSDLASLSHLAAFLSLSPPFLSSLFLCPLWKPFVWGELYEKVFLQFFSAFGCILQSAVVIHDKAAIVWCRALFTLDSCLRQRLKVESFPCCLLSAFLLSKRNINRDQPVSHTC